MRSVIAFTAVLVLTAAPALLRAEDATAPDAAKVEKGTQVFAAQKCSMCHAIAGKGNSKNPLDDVGSKLTVDQIKSYVTNPKGAKADSKMKAYPTLAADDLDALATYLSTLKKQ
jgi:mono/diheme cytochrome c family protein